MDLGRYQPPVEYCFFSPVNLSGVKENSHFSGIKLGHSSQTTRNIKARFMLLFRWRNLSRSSAIPANFTWSSSHCYPVWFESVASTRDLMSPNFFFFCIAICFCWNTLQSNYLRSHPQNSLETTSIYQCQDRLNQSQSLMLSVAHLSNSLETSMQSKGEGWGFIFLQAPELLRSWSHLGSDLTHWTVISNNSHHGPLNVSKRKTHVFHRCHHSHMIMCPAIVNDTSNLFVCYYIHM